MTTARDGGRSRVTATLRLLTALWLIGYGLWVFGDPGRASSAAGGVSLGVLLPLAGLSFALKENQRCHSIPRLKRY